MDIILFDKKFMEPLFNALERCVGIEQNNKYHPEKDVFNHSLQVLRLAFRETIDTDLILAAMLHDVGKADNKLGHKRNSKIGRNLFNRMRRSKLKRKLYKEVNS